MVSIQIEDNTFYRKSTIGASSVIKTSPHFPDVAYGQSNTEIALEGGLNVNAWLISGQVASAPKVGMSTIKGGNLILYGKSVDLTETGGVPNAKVYKMKDGLTYTEGGMAAGTNANKLAVFAAYNNPEQYTYEENFDGADKTLGTIKVLGNDGSTAVMRSDPYVSSEHWADLLSHQANGTSLKSASYSTSILGDPDRTNLDILKKFFASDLSGEKGTYTTTETHTVRIPSIRQRSDGSYYVHYTNSQYTTTKTHDKSQYVMLAPVNAAKPEDLWKPKLDLRGTSGDESGVRVIVPYFQFDNIRPLVEYQNTEDLSTSEEAVEPTSNTTIFDQGLIYTTPDISTFYGAGDNTGTPVTRSTLGLSSEKFHTGGQSLHMYHLWQFSTANQDSDSVETYFGKKDEFSNQYSCVGMKNIPYPIPIDHALSTSTGDELPNRGDYRLNLPEIEISFYLDEMDTVPRIGSYSATSEAATFTSYQATGTDTQDCIVNYNIDVARWSGSSGTPNNTFKTLGRNFTVTFANYPPEEGESLDAYILRGMDDFYSGTASSDNDAPNKIYNNGSKYIGALTIYRDIALPTDAGIEDDGQIAIAQSLPTRANPKAGRVTTSPGSSPFPAGYFSNELLKFVSGNTGATSAANMVAFGGKTKPGTEGSGFVPSVALSMNKWVTAKFVFDVMGQNAQDAAQNATQFSTGGETATSRCNQMKVFFTDGYVSGTTGVGAADPFAFHPDIPSLDIMFPIKVNDSSDGDVYASSIDWFNNRKYWPNVMCIWATNYRHFSAESGSSTYMEAQPWTSYDSGKARFGIIGETPETTPSDKQTSVFIDSIKFNNFTNTVQNASAEAGVNSQAITIKEYGIKSPKRPSIAYVAAGGAAGTVPSWKLDPMDSKLHDYYSPTYLLMGFENKESDLQPLGGGNHTGVFMFNGFGTLGFSKILKQTAETTQCFLSQKYNNTSTLDNKQYSGYWLQNMTFLSGNSNSLYSGDTNGYFSSTAARTVGNGLWPQKLDATGFTTEVSAGATVGGFSFVSGSDGKLYNDAMTQKGVGHLVFNPDGTLQGQPGDSGAGTTATGWFKCEHPFVSAKITSIPAYNEEGGAGGFTVNDTRTFEVDNPSIFHLDDDTSYVIYVAGGHESSSTRDTIPTDFDYGAEVYTAAQVKAWGGDPQWSSGGTTGSIKIMETTSATETELVVNPGTVTGSQDLFNLAPNLWLELTGTDGSTTEIVRVIDPYANPQDAASPTGVNDVLVVERAQANTDAQSYAANSGGVAANSGLPIKQFISAKGLTKVEEVKGNTITIDTPLDPLLTPENLPFLYVSPYKYWTWIQLWPGGNTDGTEIFPWKDTGGSSGKSYISILPMTTGSDATSTTGSTYNEEKYTFVAANKATKGTMSPYSNTWDLSLGEDSAIDLSQDWGEGAYNEAENTGGYLDISPVYTSTECNLNLSGMTQGLQPDQSVVTKLTLDMPLSKQTITVYGNDYVDAGTVYAADVKPYYLWSYDAPVGNINNLEVKPTIDLLKDDFDLYSITDENLSSVRFTWDESMTDVWYRMLMVDVSGATIPHKYYRASLHVPLNEVPTTATVCPDYKFYDYNARTGTSTISTGTVATGSRCRGDIQGANGYAFKPLNGNAAGALLITGGTDNTATKNAGFGDSKTQFTFVIHFTAGASSGTGAIQNIMAQGNGTNSVSMNLDESSGFATFNFTNSDGDSYDLTSKSSVAFDEETPMSVIITYKANSDAGPDMQMFVDGVREDYLQTVTGSISSTPNINIGSNHTPTAATIFRGTIEEFIIYDRAYYIPEDAGSYVLNTADIADAAGNKKLTHNARLFVYDYHNIRGEPKNKVAFSDEVNWGATSL